MPNCHCSRAVALLGGLLVPGLWLVGAADIGLRAAQDPSGSEPETPVFRTTATLATVDVVVTDRQGRHVTDLTPDDFEVVAEGRRRTVRQVAYVPLGSVPVPPADGEGIAIAAAPERPRASSGTSAEAGGPPLHEAPRSRIATPSADSTRVVAIVVDDLGLSWESTASVRRSLRKFVDQQVQDGDLVAILRTSGGIGALQQFTSDRRLMHAAADRIRWSALSRAGVTPFTPLAGAYAGPVTESDDEDSIDGRRNILLAAMTLNALEYIVQGIGHLPGRKAVVFFSEGFRLHHKPKGLRSQGDHRVWRGFQRLMDRANSAGVVVYSIDPRGLVSGMPMAEDSPTGPTPEPNQVLSGDLGGTLPSEMQDRRTFIVDSQETLHYVAGQTGGFAVVNNNDLNLGLRRVLDDFQGYYLVGYEAPDLSAGAWEPGRVSVKVRRPGLRLRSRGGRFGPAEHGSPKEPAGGDPLIAAAVSPFGAADIPIRLTSLFAYDRDGGAYIRSLLFIDPNFITFTRGADGRHEASLDVLQAAVGENGFIEDEWRSTVSLSLTGEQLQNARAQGVAQSTRIIVKRDGAYQIRVAVRDTHSGRLGSASQFVEVPQIGKGRLAVSGLLLQALDQGARTGTTAAAVLASGPGEGLSSDVLGKAAVRIFTPGSDVLFACEIYEGLPKDAPERLVMSTALLRGNRVVYRSEPSPVGREARREPPRVIPIAGRLSLGRDVPPGAYTLQVTVHQKDAPKRAAHQWADFEVRE